MIVGEKVEKIEDIKSSSTYVLLSKNEGIVYKRLMKNQKTKEKLTLISDNPIYEPYTVNEEEVLEIWKAVYILQKAHSVQRWDMNQLAGAVNNLQEEVQHIKSKMT